MQRNAPCRALSNPRETGDIIYEFFKIVHGYIMRCR
jgi:hypothetical protein